MRFALLCACALGLSACQSVMFTGVTEGTHAAAESRTIGTVLDDAGIYTEINHYYLQTDINDLLPNVNVVVRQGRVLLTGVVKSADTVERAVELAWRASGVVEVINELIINPEGYGFMRANDEWVEKQVEAKLALAKGVNILNYSIEVVQGNVYLLGVVAEEQELKNALAVSRRVKGVKQVISHLRMAEPRELVRPDPTDKFEKPKYRR